MPNRRILFLVPLFAVVFIGAFFLFNARRSRPTSGPVEAAATAPVHSPVRPPTKSRITAARPVAPDSPPAGASPFWQRFLAADTNLAKIDPASLARYLQANGTNAESLLAAFQTTHDTALLKMAATNFPGDPAIQMTIAAMKIFPGQERVWLDRLKESDPENSLANFLSAAELLKSKHPEAAFKELNDAAAKTKFDDYSAQKVQGLEEIYMADGRPPAEAKALAAMQLILPHMIQMRELSREMADLQKQYIARGDSVSAEGMSAVGMNLGQRLISGDGARTVIGQLVGISIERNILANLPEQNYSFLQDQTPKQKIADLLSQKNVLQQDAKLFNSFIQSASEADLVNYFDRMKLSGEHNAFEWIRNRVPTQ